jgi:hypothetical protein
MVHWDLEDTPAVVQSNNSAAEAPRLCGDPSGGRRHLSAGVVRRRQVCQLPIRISGDHVCE